MTKTTDLSTAPHNPGLSALSVLITTLLLVWFGACRTPEDRTANFNWQYQWDSDDPTARIAQKYNPKPLPEQGAILFPPAVAPDGTVYLRKPHYYSNPKGDSLVATGDINQWELRPEGGLCTSPAIADDGTILFGTGEGSAWAVSPTGTQKWAYKFPSASYFPAIDYGGGSTMPARSPACIQPAIAADGTSYWVGHGVYALRSDGTQGWAFEPGEDFLFVCIGADGTIYALADGGVFAIAPDGTQRWKFALEKSKYAAGDLALGADDTVYVTSLVEGKSKLLMLTPQGILKRQFASPDFGTVFASPEQTRVAADGTVYVTKKADNRTYVVAIDPKGDVRWTGPEASHTLQLASDGTVYICRVRDLVAMNSREKILWTAQLPENPGETESHEPTQAVTLASDGKFYIGDFLGRLGTLDTSLPLAAAGWPARFHDARNTSRAGAR